MSIIFTPAARRKSRLRLALSGPSGSGKTYSALLIAKGIGGRIAVVDTEHGSASLYSHLVPFDVLELQPPYTPERYIEAIVAASGYDVLILDSITHEWNGKGGVLEIVDHLTQTTHRGNSYAAWGKATPRHRAFIDAMLQASPHLIATMRSKTAYVEGERAGKKTYVKAGVAPEQRDGMEYEFTAVLDMNNDSNLAVPSKDRTGLFTEPVKITPDTGKMLAAWLDSGADPGLPPVETPPEAFDIEDAIARLDTIRDRNLLVIYRDTVRAICQERDDREGYHRFVEALKARAAALPTEVA